MIKKRAAAAAVIISLLLNGSAFTYADDVTDIDSLSNDEAVSPPNELLYSEELIISDGLEYKRNIYSHHSYGNEREYILEYTPSEETTLNFACNEYLYQTAKLKDMASYNYPESNFVAGINGDFFNMSTGVPESAFIKDYELYTTDRDSFCLAETDDGRYFFDKPQIQIKMYAQDGTEISIAHLNKEFTEYALYLYNSRYSPVTHIKNSYSEAVLLPYEDVRTADELVEGTNNPELISTYYAIETDEQKSRFYTLLEAETGYMNIADKFYLISGIFPSIGYSENLVVSRVDADCNNSEIPENAYLLCGDNTSYGYIVSGMKPGDTFELKITGNEAYCNVLNAIGVGEIIVNNSVAVNSTTLSHYASLQPRSAVGIKEDGTLVFYAADGRQKNTSAGLKLIDLAETMKSLGCVYAANLDGGGSTAVSASRPGTDEAVTVNTPSGGSERKISNGFIFTNELEKTYFPYSAHVYMDSIITFSDWMVQIPEPTISDSNGFAYITDENEAVPEVSFFTEDGNGIIADGVFYPSGTLGKSDIYASVNGMLSAKPAFSVFTVSAPDRIKLSADSYEIAPFESLKLNVSAFYKNMDIISGPESFIWSVKASEEPYATGLCGKVENGIFYPFKDGEEYTLTASRGEVSDSITLTVDAYPFEDIKNHWAVKEIYTLAKAGVVNGYPDDFTGLYYYLPQRSYSRYEFCVMLQRMTGIGSGIEVPDKYTEPQTEEISEPDTSESESDASEAVSGLVKPVNRQEPAADDVQGALTEEANESAVLPGFADLESVPDWAYDAVYKLYASGLLDGIMQTDALGNKVFNGTEFITRADVMHIMGQLCEAAPEDYSTDMYYDLTEEQKSDEYIRSCLYSGIFSGYEDMSVKPYGFLTRAEAAAVFIRLDEYLSKLQVKF